MDWKFEKICIQYLTQGWNVKLKTAINAMYRRIFEYNQIGT